VTAQGYRPVLVNGYTTTTGSDNYVVIFEKPPSTPPWVARHGLTGTGYQQEFDTWVAQGFRPTHFSGYGVGSEARYAVIFDKPASSPAWVARHGMTSSQYQATFNEQVGAGLTLTLVSGYTVNNVDYYSALFEGISGPAWIARHGATSAGYQSETENLYYQGYRLKCLSGYTIGGASHFAVIWENLYFSPSDLSKIDTPLQTYLNTYSIPGLSLAITLDDRLVFAKGLGFANKETGEAVNANRHLFRIASVSKTITAFAIMKLIDEGRITLNSTVFGTGAILSTRYGTKPYSDWTKSITVQHLLEHTSGIPAVSQEWLGLSPGDMVSWIIDNAQPTIEPGTVYSYLNSGYGILGRVIESVTGSPYEDYLRNNILNSSPHLPNRMLVGDSTPRPDEVTYYPNDGLNRRLFDSFGGWTARPIDLVGVLSRMDGLSRPDIISDATRDMMWTASTAQFGGGYGKGWSLGADWRGHNGYFPQGTIAWLVRRNDGFGFAIVLNLTPPGDGSAKAYELKGLVDGIIQTVGAWPTYDLF
jgi:CubicO group peptidase (beta-lactamase class C family)